MFPCECEPTLTRLLRNKLKDRAYTAVEDDVFSTIEDFVDKLKTIFGASKSVNQYRGELGNIIKGKTEHVIDYISRVKDLHCAILDGEIRGLGALSIERSRYFENETLTCFIAGLPPDFRLRLRLEGYTNLASAYATAIRVEKEIERDKTHFSFKPETRPVPHQPAQVKTSTSERTVCEHCRKTGHAIEKCWMKNPDLRPKRNNQKENRNRTENGTCDYCSKPGHTRDQCFKRKNDENKKQGNENSRPPYSGAQRTERRNEHPVRVVQTSEMEEQLSNELSDMQTSA